MLTDTTMLARIHVPLIQAFINCKRTRFELNAELSNLETCTAYSAEGRRENCRKFVHAVENG